MSLAYHRGASFLSRIASLSSCLGSQPFQCAATTSTASPVCQSQFAQDFRQHQADPAAYPRQGHRQGLGNRAFHTSQAHFANPSERDFYQVLGVDRSASDAELKKAYYKVAKQYHPDTNKGDATAASKFQEASRAYETLKDPQKRAMYDQFGEAGAQSDAGGFGGFSQGQQMNPEELFKMFFGGGNMGFYEDPVMSGKVGQDLQATLNLTFEEAAKGGRKVINLGRFGGDVEVDIPPGMFEGQMLTVRGKGAAASRKDGKPGNLLVGLQISSHPLFKRRGFDVHVDKSIDFVDAALGTQLRVQTIDGPVDVTVRPGAQNNDTLRIGGKGISKELQGLPGRRGDQIVHLRVTFPRRLSKRQKELLEEFRRDEQASNQNEKAHVG